ncbi:MAG: hypothetical protein JKY65_26600 [Planctomycetes bacterium]|nr:hypothetical protein [Planctomycetota bacterium]
MAPSLVAARPLAWLARVGNRAVEGQEKRVQGKGNEVLATLMGKTEYPTQHQPHFVVPTDHAKPALLSV